MRTTWTRRRRARTRSPRRCRSIVSAFAPFADARAHVDAAAAPRRRRHRARALACRATARRGSAARRSRRCTASSATTRPTSTIPRALAAFFALVQRLARDGPLLAYHDIADGGLFVTLAEMAFASRCGLDVDARRRRAALAALFAEELGAVVQVRRTRRSTRSSRDARARGSAARGGRRARCATRAHRRRATASARCSTSRASTCIARGRRPRTRCSGCATTRRCADAGVRAHRRRDDPGLVAASDVRSRRRRRRAVRRARRAAARRDPARAGRQRPGRDGGRVRPRGLRRLRRAHERPRGRAATRCATSQGFVALRRLLVRRRARRGRGLGEVDPASTPRVRDEFARVLRARRHVRARRVQRLPDDEQPARRSSPAPRTGRASCATSRSSSRRASCMVEVQRVAVAVLRAAWRAAASPSPPRTAKAMREFRDDAQRRGRAAARRAALRRPRGRRDRSVSAQPERLAAGHHRAHHRRRPLHDPDAAPRARVPHRADVVASRATGPSVAVDAACSATRARWHVRLTKEHRDERSPCMRSTASRRWSTRRPTCIRRRC